MTEKVRVPNFTSSEKLNLLRIISNKYSSILEDKKTDRASVDKKEKAWLQITDDFNASSSTSVVRSMVSLKKCYENRKKELRKTLANKKKEVTLTGEGPLPKIKKDETDEILMSIINKNTLVGFQNKFDNDADKSPIEFKVPNEDDENELELLLLDETETGNTHVGRDDIYMPIMDETISHHGNMRKYNANKLQEPISPALTTNSTILNIDQFKKNVPGSSQSTPTKSQRRPTTVVKTLTSSDIAMKYDILLDKRLMLVEGQLNHMNEENALIIRKRKLEIELLETELLLKKQSIQRGVQ